jgi:hypothetical protein
MRRLPVFLLLVVLLGATPLTTNAEAGKATLTIRARVCPAGYVHEEYPTICGDKPLANQLFQALPSKRDEGSGHTDSQGNVTISLDPGTYLIAGPPGDFLDDQFLTCSPDQGNFGPHGPVVLDAGENVICDYYAVPGRRCEACPATPTPPAGAGHIRYFDALVCEYNPGPVSTKMQPYPPGGCTMPAGIKLTATTGDGQLIGSCITENGGYCAMHVPYDVVILSEDVNTLPDGYSPRANPQLTYFIIGEGASTVVNIPNSAQPTAAAADSSITVHGRVCPAGYTGSDYFKDCHGNLPSYPQMMFLTGHLYEGDELAKTVDVNGDVTFSELVPEDYQLFLGLPPDNLLAFVQCSTTEAPDVILETNTVPSKGWSFTSIDLGPGQDIVCDAYTIPPAA